MSRACATFFIWWVPYNWYLPFEDELPPPNSPPLRGEGRVGFHIPAPAAKKAAKICKRAFFCLKPFSVVYIIIVNKIAGHKYGK